MTSTHRLLGIVLSLLVVLSACSQKPKDKKMVASVNDSPIFLSELQNELSLQKQQYPDKKITSDTVEDHLKTIIERKLMIQEAVKKGLSEDEQFAQTIQRFWEQTLIRELINAKSKEWEGILTVTDEEIGQAYERMRHRELIRAARADSHETAEIIRRKMENHERVEHEETVGPCFYDEVRQSPLKHAFDMKAGETGLFPCEGGFVVLSVVQKQSITLPPLKGMRENIRLALLEQKREKALSVWMEVLRKSAKIQIDKNLVTEAVYAK